MNPHSRDLFVLLRDKAGAKVPQLADVPLYPCPEAEREHRASPRQFCHYNHRSGAICYSRAIDQLALPWKIGILGHELGHAFADVCGIVHSEEDANRFGSVLIGSTISFKGPLNLEWSSTPKWLKEALRDEAHVVRA